jgi:hypothetical protein
VHVHLRILVLVQEFLVLAVHGRILLEVMQFN